LGKGELKGGSRAFPEVSPKKSEKERILPSTEVRASGRCEITLMTAGKEDLWELSWAIKGGKPKQACGISPNFGGI